MSDKFTYECTDCRQTFMAGQVIYLCPVCSENNHSDIPPRGILEINYDYEKIRKFHTFKSIEKAGWVPLLPIKDISSWPNMRIGNTPLYKIRDNENLALKDHVLLIKDDSQNPSFSFKDRASALVSAFAKENNINTIVAASTGNAGSSLACICSNQGQKAIIYVPAAAPKAKLLQIHMHGAKLMEVNGTYDDAFELSLKATRKNGWYNRNTGFNPLTIDGKKTVIFEVFSQLDHKLPDRIFVPTGDGVILCGVYKGCEDLFKLRMIDRIPEIIAVQSSGSDNLIRNMEAGTFNIVSSRTIADSISVDVPKNYYMSVNYLRQHHGKGLLVTDQEILNASSILARSTGIFAEPAASAAMAGYLKYKEQGILEKGSTNLVLSTGSGLKDIHFLDK